MDSSGFAVREKVVSYLKTSTDWHFRSSSHPARPDNQRTTHFGHLLVMWRPLPWPITLRKASGCRTYKVNCPNLGHTLIVCGTDWQAEKHRKTKGYQSKLWGVDLLQPMWLGDLPLLEDRQCSATQTSKHCRTVLIWDTWLKLDVVSCAIQERLKLWA